MQNSECKMKVFAAQMIEIVGEADTIILHLVFCINGTATDRIVYPSTLNAAGGESGGEIFFDGHK